MERYNLSTGGIEVVIGESNITAPKPIKTTVTNQTNFKKSSPALSQHTVRSVNLPAVPTINEGKAKLSHYVAARFLMFVGVVALVGNIPVYSKISNQTHYSDGLAKTTQADNFLSASFSKDRMDLNLPTRIETYSGHAVDMLPSSHQGKWLVHRITNGDNLEKILGKMGLKEAHTDLIAHPKISRTLRKIATGKKIFVQAEDNKIKQLIYAIDKKKAYIVYQKDGEYQIRLERDKFEKRSHSIALTIKQSLHSEAQKAGIPIEVTRQLSKIFRKDIDFRRLHVGDQVSVIFNEYNYQGERLHIGQVLAAEFHHRKRIYQRLLFIPNNGKPRHVNPDNKLALKKSTFDRRPLRTGRLSSGYGYRRHPILGLRKLHSGIDIAAPRGTPIYATGSGTVRHIGRKGGYGKTIVLSHPGNIRTLYGHMSRYKKGLRVGQKIKRGTIIGYVGSTGRSTGNHVHYEYRINGKSVNPMTARLPVRGVFSPQERNKFRRQAKNLTTELLKLRETASIERNVTQQFGG